MEKKFRELSEQEILALAISLEEEDARIYAEFADGLREAYPDTAGGIGHTLPFMISNFHVAFGLAVLVVTVELAVISYIRHRYMETPILSAAFQVVLGGALVFATGILIGNS